MSTTPPTTTAGAPLPPAQTAAPPEATMLEGVVDALRPMFGAQAPNIDTWKTRLLVERKLNEKKSRDPLQGVDITVEALFNRAVDGWGNPAIKSGALLRAACTILGVAPVPAAPQPPTAQPAATPMWGSFPAALPEVAETTTTVTTTPDKAAKKAAKAAKRARQRALLAGIAAVVAAVAAVIAAIASGWAAFIAAAVAVGAGIAGAIISAKTFQR